MPRSVSNTSQSHVAPIPINVIVIGLVVEDRVIKYQDWEAGILMSLVNMAIEDRLFRQGRSAREEKDVVSRGMEARGYGMLWDVIE